MIRLRVNLSDQLGRFSAAARGRAAEAVRRQRKDILTGMAGVMERHILEDVFNRQATPRGVPWAALQPLTILLRRALGIPGTKAGTGPANAMIQSFRIGGAGNHFSLTATGFEYGSDLRRKGHLVASTFQQMYAIPKAGAGAEAKRERIRGFIFALTGWRSPGKGKHFAHLAREIIDLPMPWLKDMADVAMSFAVAAAIDGLTDAMRQARLEVEAVRARRPSRAGLRQFF